MREFRDFATRGNVVDLAIAVVLGAAFGAVVTSFVENLLTPLIAAIFGEPDFSSLSFTINESRFAYGAVVNTLLAFTFIAAAIFFLVVKPLNALAARRKQGDEPPAEPTDEIRLLTEIRDALRPR
ncbi:MAG: large conductance mechanosensitive channel protein MscL [Thermoleophilia bacterium]|nr:large conductance mechanosensitive channel protein MscL [Thermoleophilia bacterium]